MRKINQRVAGILSGAQVHDLDNAAAEFYRHARIERYVGQYGFHFGRIEIERFEKREAALELKLLVLDHTGDDIAVRNYGGAGRLERRIAVEMVAVRVGVDHPPDRLVGDPADALDQIAAVRRMLARIDHQHALVRHQESRI